MQTGCDSAVAPRQLEPARCGAHANPPLQCLQCFPRCLHNTNLPPFLPQPSCRCFPHLHLDFLSGDSCFPHLHLDFLSGLLSTPCLRTTSPACLCPRPRCLPLPALPLQGHLHHRLLHRGRRHQGAQNTQQELDQVRAPQQAAAGRRNKPHGAACALQRRRCLSIIDTASLAGPVPPEHFCARGRSCASHSLLPDPPSSPCPASLQRHFLRGDGHLRRHPRHHPHQQDERAGCWQPAHHRRRVGCVLQRRALRWVRHLLVGHRRWAHESGKRVRWRGVPRRLTDATNEAVG
jgi:hypothetical protein